ncbi:protein-methionine-sulfoxide reductase heme-binding subunit MsrQ [Photobacterium lipolyticum]|uniref:Protein-methionine-sulfoxide reductase heme-binding subunit MsrQ n=1 Tax=Photobacterium lipolyticum TaxID=266810 RepID=A0A2T3MZ36_9GAMM|nr:protein-methionine-sulfoxide reductase heme-binding subunit MsrQ [Photobacterium lipolyticum]PSW05252.1 protein-methionine-sulfoxide reductase heme-binding subunit MsrQ [Photobacterium lipolyticum]
MKITPRQIFWLKVFIHTVSLGFLLLLFGQTLTGNLGADPIEGISHFTGKAALNTLLLTLLISPVARYFKQGSLVKIRRLVGIYSFFWAVLHLAGYLILDLGLNWQLLGSEIISRPYLTLGAISWIILGALAATSSQGMQRRLGRQWQKLHNWVYLALILSPIHYYWSVKSGVIEPGLYLIVATVLLACRWKTFKHWLPTTPSHLESHRH